MSKLESGSLAMRLRIKRCYALALTHPSALGQAQDNQRLEFLGDAVLEYCVSEMLFKRSVSATASEGELTARRAALVCEDTLCLSGCRSWLWAGNCAWGYGEEHHRAGGKNRPSSPMRWKPWWRLCVWTAVWMLHRTLGFTSVPGMIRCVGYRVKGRDLKGRIAGLYPGTGAGAAGVRGDRIRGRPRARQGGLHG